MNPLARFDHLLSPWMSNPNGIWLSSQLIFHRNVEDYLFSEFLPAEDKTHLVSLFKQQLLPLLNHPIAVEAQQLTPIEREFVGEHFWQSPSLQKALPGEVYFLDSLGEFFGLAHRQEHLAITLLTIENNLEAIMNRLINFETTLHQVASFSFSPKFGFLTSDFRQCGTGFTVEACLHLPLLSYFGELRDRQPRMEQDGVTIQSIYGDGEGYPGDLFVLRNLYHLGVSEETVLQSVKAWAFKLIIAEQGLREKCRHTREGEESLLKDKVSRSFALLSHSYQIEMKELFEAWSYFKLGIDLKWIIGMPHDVLNRLLFLSRRAHLTQVLGKELQPHELPHYRAEFVQQTLRGSALIIDPIQATP